MQESKLNDTIEVIKKAGIIRSRDIGAYGIQREYLRRLSNRGVIKKIGRGLYSVKDTGISEHHGLVEACRKAPNGVICLLSALHFHELTTQLPFEVWIAIDNKSRKPKEGALALRVMRFSGDALKTGVEEHIIEGEKVRVYGITKTIADCFKYRNKIGLDVAIEALQECWKKKQCSMDMLWENARICRVSNVMRPYLDTLK